ncbi:hypothetical protein MKX01_041921 [Papaver californicum]|nr:hypothetical protein MKX01_041921 [Papaver californicum]
MSKFQFNVPSHLVLPNLEENFSRKFRSFKYCLRHNYFRIANSKAQVEATIRAGLDPNAWKSKEKILAKVPIGISPSAWTKIHAKKTKNKMKFTIPHTLGRCTYTNKYFLLRKGRLQNDREYAWMKGHKRHDGSVYPSAVEKYEQVKAAYAKRKKNETGCSNDFGSNALAGVFGPEKGKRTLRGLSSSVLSRHSSQLPFVILQLTNATVLETKISSNHPTNERTNEVPILDDPCTPNLNFIPKNHSFSKNLDHAPEPQSFDNFSDEESATQYVNLLDRDENIVATGYVANGLEGEVCDDHYKLSAYVAGGWLIWNKKCLQYLN